MSNKGIDTHDILVEKGKFPSFWSALGHPRLGHNQEMQKIFREIKKIMKPTKKAKFWDAQEVLEKLELLGDTENLSCYHLACKATFLVHIKSGWMV